MYVFGIDVPVLELLVIFSTVVVVYLVILEFEFRQLRVISRKFEDDEIQLGREMRELKEEIGFGARHIEFIKKLNLAPGHMGFTINLLLATDLYPERLPGDEPEPPEVVTWPLEKLEELIAGDEFREARAIAGLFLVRQHLNGQG